MLTIFMNGKNSGTKISRAHLSFHTPKKADTAWKIVDDETGEVVDRYTPLQDKRPKPTTSWIGSWASQVNQPGFMR